MPPTLKTIRHFKSEWGAGAELRPEIVSWIVTDDAPVSYWPICSLFPVTPRGLCESQLVPDFLSFLKWQMALVTSPLGFSAFR